MTQLHIYYRLGLTTIGKTVRQVVKAIWSVMKNECIPDVTCEKWKCIAEDFLSVTNFPNCFGALDGKHVRLTKPWNSGSMYFNYKSFCSVVLMAMCDANYLFTFIDVGGFGKESDSTILKRVNGSSPPLPYVIVADEAFSLANHVMRPYPRKSLTVRKKVYNYRLSRARRCIECAFGLLSNKWQIFHRAMNVDVSFAEDIIKACCILHNFVRSREGYKFEETLNVVGFQDLSVDVETIEVRKKL